MFRTFLAPLAIGLLASSAVLAQDQSFTTNPYTCFDKPMEAKLRFVEGSSKIRLLWEENEVGTRNKYFVELITDKSSGDLIFTRNTNSPYLRVENYGTGEGMATFRIKDDLTNDDYCTPITFVPAAPPAEAYQAYVDQVAQENLSADQLIDAVVSKSTLWNKEFLTRSEQRALSKPFNDSEKAALEAYVQSVTDRLQAAKGDADDSKVVLDELARVHGMIDSRSFRRNLKKAYEQGYDLVARINFLDGKDPLALAAPTAQEFCARLDSPLGTTQGTSQLVRASGVAMGFWTDALMDKYIDFALDCRNGKDFTRNVEREQKRNARDRDLREGLFAEYQRLMAVPITLSDMRDNSWMRLESQKISGYSVNAASLDRFSAERLPARRTAAVDPLRTELHQIIDVIGDQPLSEYRKSCSTLKGETDSYNKLAKAVFDGCQEIVTARVDAELLRLAEQEPAAATQAAEEARFSFRDQGMSQDFCRGRVLKSDNFKGIHQNKILPIYTACVSALMNSGVDALVNNFASEAQAILDSPRTLAGLRDNNWYIAPSAQEVIIAGTSSNAPQKIKDAVATYLPLLKAARAEAADNAEAELTALQTQSNLQASTATDLQQICDALPEDIATDLMSLESKCDDVRAVIAQKLAAEKCAPMWVGTKKTDDMQAGTFIAPEMNGADNAYVQSYFCRAGRADLTYEIVQDSGFFSTDTFIAVTIGAVDGLTAPAVLQAQIVPNERFEGVYDIANAQITGQGGKTIGVKGNSIFLLACISEPSTCQLDR